MYKKSHDNIFRMSVTGIDGSGKDSVTSEALKHQSVDSNIVQLGRPAYEYREGEAREIFQLATRAINSTHDWADRHNSKKAILGISATNVVLQTRILERLAANRTPRPDIIASTRDERLDPAVYIDFYGGNKTKSLSIEKRIKQLQRLTNIKRDLIVQLVIDPEESIRRIQIRANSDGEDSKRQHMHENIDDLAMLAASYKFVSRHLQRIQPHRSVTIDVNNRDFNEVSGILYDVINASRNGDIATGESIEI